MARTTFSGPVHSKNGFVGDVTPANPVQLPSFELSELPDAAENVGKIAYVSDANINAGAVVFSNGSDWIDPSTGLAVA